MVEKFSTIGITNAMKTDSLSKKVSNSFRNLHYYLYVSPALLIYTVFWFYPMVQSVRLSLYRYDGINPARFVGFVHFFDLMRDSIFFTAIKNTLFFTFGVTILQTALGLILAVFLSQIVRGRTFFRVAYFIPVLMPLVIVGILWRFIYMPDFGIINPFLEKIGLGSLTRPWLSDKNAALPAIMWVSIWKWVGFTMVIYLASIQGISPEYYDAAKIDGANRFQLFWHITVPLVKTATQINILLTMIGGLRVFDLVYVMTEGGPGHATEVVALYVYKTGFTFYRMGEGCAIAVLLFILIMIPSVFYVIKGKLGGIK